VGLLGNIYMLEGDARQAIPCYRRALAAARQLSAESYASVWAVNLADALAEAGEWEAAAQLSREAQQQGFQDEQTKLGTKLTQADIATGRKLFVEAERLLTEIIDSAPRNPAQLWEAHASLANLYREIGRRHKAGQHFEIAIRLMEKTRSDLFRAEHRVTFLSRWIRFYQHYVDLLMEEGDSGKAFQVAEMSRTRVLAERIGSRRVPSGPAILSQYQKAARRMGRCFLSYWIAPRRSFLWVITPHQIRTFMIPGENELAVLVHAHQESIRNLRDSLTVGQSAGRRLYSVLLAEAAALMPAGSNAILVPDGPLHNLNFETLPVPGERPHYWVEDVKLAVAPSLSGIISKRETKPKASDSILVIGDPEPVSADYPKLNYAVAEIAEIESKFPNVPKILFTGIRANPAAYRESRPEQFSIIHFAAHGLANPASPLDSAIVLSVQNGASLLYARDIAEYPLRAQLVTIASCRSAGAKAFPGEGLLGLAWAFLRAGAADVIAALRDVNDKSTSEIMAALYAGVAAGKPVTEALHTAKVEMARRSDVYRKPYYWGSFQSYTRASFPR